MNSVSVSSPLRKEIAKFLQLAIPLASAQVAQSLTGFFDTIMMGRLGAESLAAGGLASLTFFAILNTAGGVVMGATINYDKDGQSWTKSSPFLAIT